MAETNRTRTFVAGGTVTKWARVVLSAGNVVVAGSADEAIGTAMDRASPGESVPVLLRNASGTRTMVASGAFGSGVKVYGAASGRVTDSAGDDYWGVAVDSAGAPGDEVEVLPAGL